MAADGCGWLLVIRPHTTPPLPCPAQPAAQKVYVTMFPCNECAKLLIQAGITEVVYHEVRGSQAAWAFALAWRARSHTKGLGAGRCTCDAPAGAASARAASGGCRWCRSLPGAGAALAAARPADARPGGALARWGSALVAGQSAAWAACWVEALVSRAEQLPAAAAGQGAGAGVAHPQPVHGG
jgi:hypothetical protein